MEHHGRSIKSVFFKDTFIISLISLGLISFAFLMKRHQAEFTNYILEAFLMIYAVAAYLWTRNKSISLVIAMRFTLFIYIVFSWFYAVNYKGANPLDFLQIYKSFLYLFFLTFLVNKKLMSFRGVNNFSIILYIIFFLKYLLMIGLGLDLRPVIFMENNFELMFLYALYLIRYSVTKEKYLHLLILIGIITIISLSRSSLIMYSVLVLFVIYDSFKKLRVFLIPGTIAALGLVVYYIFSARAQSLEEIDRYRFMLIWWTNVDDWNLLQWLVGAERITPLNGYSCGMMNYFKNLFSYSGDGTCYSVILHSFIFRVLYDHGVLGFLFIITATYQLLIRSKVRKDITIVFITIVLINGFSVSSFNNLFFAISMAFLMITNTAFPKSSLTLSSYKSRPHENKH